MKRNCLLVDDEAPALRLLEEYVSKVPGLAVVHKTRNPQEGRAYLAQHEVHILFLDIQMPGLTGLELLKSIEHPPRVVLTTAYSEHAATGFELAATDYLLKPFSFERFLKAVEKCQRELELAELAARMASRPEALADAEQVPDTWVVRADGLFYRLRYEDVLYVEGMREYVRIVTTERKLIILAALKDLESELPADSFMRIHKSYIVNLRRVKAIGGNEAYLQDITLPIGQSFKDAVHQKFLSR